MLKVAVIIRNVTAKILKFTAIIRSVTQNVELCSHNSKCDCNFQYLAVRFRNLQPRDCNFHVAAIFQNL